MAISLYKFIKNEDREIKRQQGSIYTLRQKLSDTHIFYRNDTLKYIFRNILVRSSSLLWSIKSLRYKGALDGKSYRWLENSQF